MRIILISSLALMLLSCTDAEHRQVSYKADYGIAKKLAGNEDFRLMVEADTQLQDLLDDGTIWIPPTAAAKLEGMSNVASVEEMIDRIWTEDFRGFELYKELSIEKYKHQLAYSINFKGFNGMTEEETAATIFSAMKLVDR